MFYLDMVHGKDYPTYPKQSKCMNGGGGGSVLEQLVFSIYYIIKVIIMDSLFFVLRGLLELNNTGFFPSALIKILATGQNMFLEI